MKLGQTVWTKNLESKSLTMGQDQKTGKYYQVQEKHAYQLTIRKAARRYMCAGSSCRNIIERGSLHGSTFYDHYCPDCISEAEPAREVAPV